MNLQQLRYVRETVRTDFNLTLAAQSLNTSQSGVSKQIRELELELGIDIFVRRGKRLSGLTRAGEGAAKLIERLLQEAENLKRHAAQFAGEERGRLVVALTHNQARYVLPAVIDAFAAEYPGVQLELKQGSPRQAAQAVTSGEADLAVATEALDQTSELSTFPCFTWRHAVIAPLDHPLLSRSEPLSLEMVATWPLVTYSAEFSGRSLVDEAFAAHGLEPDIRLAAMDSDIIKTYVARGLGLGIISEMALGGGETPGLAILRGSPQLFAPTTTKIAVLRGALLHAYAYHFIELLAPHLPRALVRGDSIARAHESGTQTGLLQSGEIPSFETYLSRNARHLSSSPHTPQQAKALAAAQQ